MHIQTTAGALSKFREDHAFDNRCLGPIDVSSASYIPKFQLRLPQKLTYTYG